MDQDATWYRGKLDLGQSHTVVDGAQLSPERGITAPPPFRPMSIVAKRSPISATVELLLNHVGNCQTNVSDHKQCQVTSSRRFHEPPASRSSQAPTNTTQETDQPNKTHKTKRSRDRDHCRAYSCCNVLRLHDV